MRLQLITSIFKSSLARASSWYGLFFQYKTYHQSNELFDFLRQSGDPAKRARAIVQAVSPPKRAPPFFVSITETASKVTHYNNPKILAEVRTRFDSNPVFRFVMVNVNGRETGLGEPRRAYGGLVNKVSGCCCCVVWQVAPF